MSKIAIKPMKIPHFHWQMPYFLCYLWSIVILIIIDEISWDFKMVRFDKNMFRHSFVIKQTEYYLHIFPFNKHSVMRWSQNKILLIRLETKLVRKIHLESTEVTAYFESWLHTTGQIPNKTCILSYQNNHTSTCSVYGIIITHHMNACD